MIIRLGFVNADIPWDINKNRTELVVLPAMSVAMTAALMAAAGIMISTGFPYLGIGLWYPFFIALVCVAGGVGTLVWDTLALPWDSKAVEYLIISGVTALAIWVNTFLIHTQYIGWAYLMGIVLVSIAWFTSSYSTWIAGLSIPPPKEELLESSYSTEFVDHVIDGRVKREVYGRINMQKMHKYWIAYTTWTYIFALAFSLLWIQYRTASPAISASIVVTLLITVFVVCSIYIVIVSSLKSKEALLLGQKVRVVGGGWHRWSHELLLASIILGLAVIVIPPNLSPLASADLDELASNFNDLMRKITKVLFSWVGGGPAPSMYNMGVSGNGAGSTIAYGRSGLLDGTGGFFTLLMLVLALTAVGLSAKYFWKKMKTAQRLSEPLSYGPGLVMLMWVGERLLTLVKLPLVLIAMIKGWLRARLLETNDYDDESALPNAFQRVLGKVRRRMLRYLLPEDPSLLIRSLYGRMVRTAAQNGLSRSPEMTANEYARYIKSRASVISPDVSELTKSYTEVRYTRKKATRTTAERAITCLKSIQKKIHSGLRRHI